MPAQHEDEKKPTETGELKVGEELVLVDGRESARTSAPMMEMNGAALAALEAAADEMARRARLAFQVAAMQPPDDAFGRRFIEHGATCYFNCWAALRKILDASFPPPSDTPAVD